MRRNQYNSEKRRKELDRKKKQEEKRAKKAERKALGLPEDGDPSEYLGISPVVDTGSAPADPSADPADAPAGPADGNPAPDPTVNQEK